MILRELILDALRVIGVIEVGQGANADEDVETLRVVNSMLNSWRTETSMAYAWTSTPYTVASNGTISVPRPERIEGVWLGSTAGLNSFSGRIYSDRAYPTSLLLLNPPPAAGTQIMLATWTVVPPFAALTDTVSVPDGYTECMIYNLALRLAPRYVGSKISPLVLEEARTSKANVKRMNARIPTLQLDNALLRMGSWLGYGTGFNSATGPNGLPLISGGAIWDSSTEAWDDTSIFTWDGI